VRSSILACLLVSAVARAQGLDSLLEQADSGHWRERWGAVQRLARQPDGVAGLLRRSLIADRRPRVREAVAWACLLDAQLGDATLLGIALRRDPDAAVRRAAARALAHFKDRRAVTALVEALAKEPDARTRLFIVQTLRNLTPAPCLLEAAAWTDWWRRHERDPRFMPADEKAKRGEYEGIVLETRTVAPVRPKGGSRRPPPHVLVLPGFGWTTAVYGPYLLPLRSKAAMTWVRLPTVQQLTGSSGYGSDVPTYPVDRLVRALDKFRSSLNLKRFIVLGSGASGWIAMRYAQRFPQRCAGLVLIDTALDRNAYAECLRRASARGDKGEKFTAKTLLHENNVPYNEATLTRLNVLGLERGFDDRADLEIGDLFFHAREPQGFATVPEIKWGRRAELDVPALFLYSGASSFSGHRDADRIRNHFPRSLVAPVRHARAMPYVETNASFHEIVDVFLKRFDLAATE
jgi:pimeloyl-ACP methyl ester carboxylesterase